MKMLNGSDAQGENEALDNAVFEFIATPMIATGSVKSFFRRGNGDPDFVQWLSEFGEEYPDAANLIRKATRKAGWYKET